MKIDTLRRFGASLLAMALVTSASGCVLVSDWDDLANAVRAASGSLTLCPFDIVKPRFQRLFLDTRFNMTCEKTGTEKCILSGPGHHVRIASASAEVVLDGFSFHAASECAVRLVRTTKTQVVKNCDFVGNVGPMNSWRGGAIKTELGTSLVVSACKFIRNKAGGGGAIYHRGNFMSIEDSLFIENIAKGGAIQCDARANLEVHDTNFTDNAATVQEGGAIAVADAATLKETTNMIGSGNSPCNGVFDEKAGVCEEFVMVSPAPGGGGCGEQESTFVPGELSIMKEGLKLSTGLTVKLLAKAGQTVALTSPEASGTGNFHDNPDGAAVYELDDGGWVYLSNSEVPNNMGGVYGMEFDSQGRPRSFSQRLFNTTRNCAGGSTPWNTWVSCEEYAHGQCWQVDPTGQRPPEKTDLVEPTGGNFESMAADFRDPDRVKFFVTEDHPYGAVRRFTPCIVPLGWEMLHKEGTIDYLEFLPGNRFRWNASLDVGRDSAFEFYPNVEGISHYGGILSFVSKVKKQIYHLDLDCGTYRVDTTMYQTLTGGGSFDAEPDQIVQMGDSIYFTEDGGNTPGIYVHDGSRMYALVEAYADIFKTDETTGLAFSPDGTKLYFCIQEIGYFFQVERTDGRPFDGRRRLGLRFHRGDD